MFMKRGKYVFIFAVIISLIFTAVGFCDKSTTKRKPHQRGMFASFVGVNQGGPSEKGEGKHCWKYISWVRTDLSWSRCEPKRGKWNRKYLVDWGKVVIRNRKYGVETLPILDYMVPWAARRSEWSFTVGNKRYDVHSWDGKSNVRIATEIDLKTGKKKSLKIPASRIPPENVKDLETFVERVVSFLSKPPYNVRYFQIWNEANDKFTGFWYGGMDEYMKTIHLPAAKIIRKYGCKVVYGGYPCNGSMSHYLSVLNKHNAWDTLDVLDVHYFPLSAWQYLYDRIKHKGREFGIWQTEIGFTKSKSWVPNNYPRFFHWAITHHWRKDRYRIFQFAYWSPDDPKAYGYNRCLLSGDRLSYHGKAFVTLGELLDADKVKDYPYWKTRPILRTEIDERKSSAEGFDCGDRIVLAIHLADQNGAAIFTDWNLTMDNMHLDVADTRIEVVLPKLEISRVKSAWRVGVYGSKLPLEVLPISKNITKVKLSVPVCDSDPIERKDNRQAGMHTFYIVVELSN